MSSALVTDIQWVLFAFLVFVAVTAVLSLTGHVGLALLNDALPLLLALSWLVLLIAIYEGAWILVGCAALLCVYHLAIVLPRMKVEHVPRWAEECPTIELIVSNVFVDNRTPELLAVELIQGGGDVLVINEWNPDFAAAFERAGGFEAYPHRVCDESDHSEYSVCILSRLELDEQSTTMRTGSLVFAAAVVNCGESKLHIFGMNATAVVDPGGYAEWKTQFAELTDLVPTLDVPFVLAGDLNSTQFRPEYRKLLATGSLTDAHDSLGKGLSGSFKLAPHGLFAAPGAVARLDHALVSADVRALRTEDLRACGSDHLPFRMTLAVRQHPAPRHSMRATTVRPPMDDDQASAAEVA